MNNLTEEQIKKILVDISNKWTNTDFSVVGSLFDLEEAQAKAVSQALIGKCATPTFSGGEKEEVKPDYYDKGGCTSYTKGVDPEVTCWHCKKTFLCDCMDATCRLCGAPYAKERCKEFNFIPTKQKDITCKHGTEYPVAWFNFL